MKKTGVLAVLAASLLCAGTLFAGMVYQIDVTEYEGSKIKKMTNVISIEGHLFKMEFLPGDQGGEKGMMLFNRIKREMTVVDHKKKSYMVIDQAMVDMMAKQMNEMKKNSPFGGMGGGLGGLLNNKELMKNVPEEDRKKLEEMMKSGGAPGMAGPPGAMSDQGMPKPVQEEYRNTGERDTVNGYDVVKYDVYKDGKKVKELWVVDWSRVEGGEEVASMFKDMAAFFGDLMSSFANKTGMGDGMPAGMSAGIMENMEKMPGLPVVTKEYNEDGSLDSESSLRSADRQTLDPDAFEPPTGYKRQQMMGGF